MPEITYVTPEGLEKIKAELDILKNKTRRELANRIEYAKGLGDLSENAEYHEAKDALGMAEGRIRELEEMMKNISVIESLASDIIHIGSTFDAETNGKKRTLKIVGSNEADPVEGLISNESPLGKAFLGHAKNDVVEVQTPGGNLQYTVIDIR